MASLMPEISRFFGIVIRMYVERNQPHRRPHFHAYCRDGAAVYDIEDCVRLEGKLPRREERLVLAWAEIHRTELTANWHALQHDRPPAKVAPLR